MAGLDVPEQAVLPELRPPRPESEHSQDAGTANRQQRASKKTRGKRKEKREKRKDTTVRKDLGTVNARTVNLILGTYPPCRATLRNEYRYILYLQHAHREREWSRKNMRCWRRVCTMAHDGSPGIVIVSPISTERKQEATGARQIGGQMVHTYLCTYNTHRRASEMPKRTHS